MQIAIDGNNADTGAQWIAGSVDQPDATAYAAGQALPAAFIEGKPLQANVAFILTGSFAGVKSISLDASNDGAYGNLSLTTATIQNGQGTAAFASEAYDDAVDVNDLSFAWKLESFSTATQNNVAATDSISTTTNRIYTLYAKPAAPMAVPWPTPSALFHFLDTTTRARPSNTRWTEL